MRGGYHSEHGQVKIHRKVIFQIAETAAQEVKGVKAVGYKCYGWWGRILRFFGIVGTKVNLERDTKVVIPITVLWGENAVDVACEVQRCIISHMFKSLNIDSINVDVKIKRVERG